MKAHIRLISPVVMVFLCFVPPKVVAQLFEPSVEYGAGDGSYGVAIADLNDDGSADLAVANFVGGDVSVLLGNGNGTFRSAVNYETGDIPQTIAIGDLNNDRIQDMIVGNTNSDDISILLGNGDGTFQAAENYDSGDFPSSVALDDLDGDGNVDLVVANWLSYDVSIYFGNGDGSFQPDVRIEAGTGPRSVAIGKLNDDSVPDLAVANLYSHDISVLLGNGDGTFQTAVNYGAGERPKSIALGDLNGDSHSDLAVTNFSNGNFSVLLGNGNGTFQAVMSYAVGGAGEYLNWLACNDLNGDRCLDLAIVNMSASKVSVLLGRGNGTFDAAVNFEMDNTPTSVAIDDLDGDNIPDLAVANTIRDEVSVLINTTALFSSSLTCTPLSGTLPFVTHMSVTLSNLYTRQVRTISGHIDVSLGDGKFYANYMAGYTNVIPDDARVFSWPQTLIGGSFIGPNVAKLVAEDVTPFPYNQPPYPPAGDTSTSACTVTGIVP